jgi:hypothetical protein
MWNKNAFMAMFRKTSGFSILGIVGKYIAERRDANKSNKGIEKSAGDRDMLSHFFECVDNNTALPSWYSLRYPYKLLSSDTELTA